MAMGTAADTRESESARKIPGPKRAGCSPGLLGRENAHRRRRFKKPLVVPQYFANDRLKLYAQFGSDSRGSHQQLVDDGDTYDSPLERIQRHRGLSSAGGKQKRRGIPLAAT